LKTRPLNLALNAVLVLARTGSDVSEYFQHQTSHEPSTDHKNHYFCEVKNNDPKNPKKNNFLRIPAFPGGKEAYLRFVQENIVYPEQALLAKVEGDVLISYTVNNIGEIVDVEVTKGIGYGCDEEAVRVIRLMKYEPARNRGVKMKAQMKTRIHFKLPGTVQNSGQAGVQLNYTSPAPAQTANSPEPKPQAVYNYTINLG
jgi:protein TonB